MGNRNDEDVSVGADPGSWPCLDCGAMQARDEEKCSTCGAQVALKGAWLAILSAGLGGAAIAIACKTALGTIPLSGNSALYSALFEFMHPLLSAHQEYIFPALGGVVACGILRRTQGMLPLLAGFASSLFWILGLLVGTLAVGGDASLGVSTLSAFVAVIGALLVQFLRRGEASFPRIDRLSSGWRVPTVGVLGVGAFSLLIMLGNLAVWAAIVAFAVALFVAGIWVAIKVIGLAMSDGGSNISTPYRNMVSDSPPQRGPAERKEQPGAPRQPDAVKIANNGRPTEHRDRTGKYTGKSVKDGADLKHLGRDGSYQGKSVRDGADWKHLGRDGSYQGKSVRDGDGKKHWGRDGSYQGRTNKDGERYDQNGTYVSRSKSQ